MRITKGFALLTGAVLLFMCFAGCSNGTQGSGGEEIKMGDAAKAWLDSIEPQVKPGGGKYVIAYVDADPFPTTGAVLYYVIESLREEGWIVCETLPFSPDNTDAGKLIDWLSERDTGPFLEFRSDANYYLVYDGEENVKQSLTRQAEAGSVDMVLSMGTSPSRFCKSLNLKVPLLMLGVVDPISSGLINSSEDSGSPYIWAQVDPSAFVRQFNYYHEAIPFTRIGIVYYDDVIASVKDYESAANALNVTIVKSKINRIDNSSPESVEEYYAKLESEFIRLINEEKIDAFIIATDIIVEDSKIRGFMNIFADNKVPVFVQIGDQYVRHGALINVSSRDYKGMGSFTARTIAQKLNGISLNELPQEYKSSPFLTLNLETADTIGYRPTFEMLLSCEQVFAKTE